MKINYLKSSHNDEQKKATNDLMKESFEDKDIANNEYYDWQYLKNPIGLGTVLLALDNTNYVGQFASIPCKFKFNEKSFLISLSMNICISPKYRGKGISTEIVAKLNDSMESAPFTIGLPNKQSMKTHLNNLYHLLSMSLLIRPGKISNYFHNPIIRIILKPFDIFWKKKTAYNVKEHLDEFDSRFDDFEKSNHKKNVFMQVRSSSFLNWRYKKNPKRNYKVFIAENDDATIEGYIVTRVTDLFGKRFGLIMDFVVNKKSDKVKNLIQNVLEDFWKNNVSITAVACFSNCIEYEILKEEGFYQCPNFLRPHPFRVCIKIFDESTYSKNLVLHPSHWFFMLGDYETF